jgi:thiosulfate dehydrogenase (quinone) large subunit
MTTRYAGRPAGELVESTTEQTSQERRLAHGVFAALRIVIGATFFWAFLDKLFGLGYATPSAKSWIHGGSPTKGFLSGSEGPFSGFYKAIAGDGWANWAFMFALAAVGTALLLGIGMRLAALGGTVLYLMMWSVVLPPSSNPLLDDHIIGALAVAGLFLVHSGDHFGLGRWWKTQPIVRDNTWLI